MRIDDSLRKTFSLLSLSDYEVRVFTAACDLGAGSAALLAKRAGIPRSSVYSVIDTLTEKGLISTERRKGSKIFIPASPDSLVVMAEEQLEDAKQNLESAKQVAEALRSARGRSALTSTKLLIYEGKRAVTQMHYEWEDEWRSSILKTGRGFLGFQDASYLHHYGDWIVHYWKKYEKKKGWEQDTVQLFSVSDEKTDRVQKLVEPYTHKRRELRPLPSQFPFSATVWVVGEYVIILKTRSEPHYALQIRDELLAENLGTFFEFAWSITGGQQKD